MLCFWKMEPNCSISNKNSKGPKIDSQGTQQERGAREENSPSFFSWLLIFIEFLHTNRQNNTTNKVQIKVTIVIIIIIALTNCLEKFYHSLYLSSVPFSICSVGFMSHINVSNTFSLSLGRYVSFSSKDFPDNFQPLFLFWGIYIEPVSCDRFLTCCE